MASINEQKDKLRQQMKLKTFRLTLSERERAAILIKERVLKLLLKMPAEKIMLYYPIKTELDTRPLLTELLQRGKQIGLPVCKENYTLEIRQICEFEKLILGKFGLAEPDKAAPLIRSDTLEMILLPGLAFDQRGYRLGYGAGYYDRFLSQAPQAFKLGLSYDFQLKSEIPFEPHDLSVDAVLTPTNSWGMASFR